MSTSSFHKHQKYFSASDVQTTIRSKRKLGKILPIYLYDEEDNRIGVLNDGDKVTVIKSSDYNYKYPIITENGQIGKVCEIFVAKPKKEYGVTENLRIQSETLITLGKDSFFSNCNTKSFTSSDQLMNSIVHGLENNWRVPKELTECFVDYASSGYKKIRWDPDLRDSDINEAGKYIGEVLPGILAFENKECFEDHFLEEIPNEFHIPIESQFSGVDSFFSSHSGIVPVSSKFGPGAKASFFSNILPEGIRRYDLDSGLRNQSVFTRIIEAAKRSGISEDDVKARRGSKEVLYEYGITEICGIRSNCKSSDIFLSLRSNVLEGKRLSGDAKEVVDKVSEIAMDPIKSSLPESTTSFFSRETARRLNEDPVSIAQMKEIIAGKDYVQLHLDMTKWRKGDVYFKVKRSSECDLKIVGNKGIMNDIDARHGTLSYELR